MKIKLVDPRIKIFLNIKQHCHCCRKELYNILDIYYFYKILDLKTLKYKRYASKEEIKIFLNFINMLKENLSGDILNDNTEINICSSCATGNVFKDIVKIARRFV